MTQTLPITYINCDFCTAKNHCAACGADLSSDLLQKPGISSALFNVPERTLQITHTLEDLLDAMGVLAG